MLETLSEQIAVGQKTLKGMADKLKHEQADNLPGLAVAETLVAVNAINAKLDKQDAELGRRLKELEESDELFSGKK